MAFNCKYMNIRKYKKYAASLGINIQNLARIEQETQQKQYARK